MKSKGFTLIELMIVVAIIAIIAAIAIPNLLRARMAANETAAVAACKAFCTAEDIYRRTDYNKDGVLEYAQTLSGANSLYSSTATAGSAGDIALVDSSFAAAEVVAGAVVTGGTPKAGHVFSVLTAQLAAAPGGARSYLSGTHMTLGYALSACPSQYDGTGRNAFLVSNSGTIYQQDNGAQANTATGYGASTTATPPWIVSQ